MFHNLCNAESQDTIETDMTEVKDVVYILQGNCF